MGRKKETVQFHDKIENYFRWPIFYIALIAILTAIAAFFEPLLGLIFGGFLLLATVMTIYLVFINRKHIMKEIVSFALKLDGNQRDLLNYFEMPYILLDSAGRVTWNNSAFTKLVETNKTTNIKLFCLLPVIQQNILTFETERLEKTYEFGQKTYRVVFRRVVIQPEDLHSKHKDAKEEIVYAVYFSDISKQMDLEIRNEEEKVVFGLIYIDNYDEVVHSIEDVRIPLLIALVDRNLNKLVKDIDGIIRKFEKDKYFIIFKKKYLSELQENKFAILDSIREINIGNEISVTLSIGIGISDDSYTSKFDSSRMAMDLALGRGGDQAVIKNQDKLSFYGGKTRGVEKSTRVKSRIKAHAFRELLEDCEYVLIMGHKLADMDSFGAAIGVYVCAKHLGKKAHIIVNKITSAVTPVYEQLLKDNDYPSDMVINNQEAISYVSDKALLVVVDVNRPSYTEYPELLKYIKKVVVFDHHRVTVEHIENAVLSYVEPYASSTCEMITEIIQYISERLKLKPFEADALFAGIAVDTKHFVAKTGVKTFEAAAFLRRSGADSVRVSKFFKNDMASYKAKATAVKDAEIYRDHVAISRCPSDIVNPHVIGAQAADELLNIAGIRASFVMTQVGNAIYVSARSVDDINVQLIMEKMGGGGHLNVAGAQLENYTIENAIKTLKENIDVYFEKGERQ